MHIAVHAKFTPQFGCHIPTLEEWKAELAWLVDPQQTPYPRSGHMSTIDQAYIREVCQPKTDALPVSNGTNQYPYHNTVELHQMYECKKTAQYTLLHTTVLLLTKDHPKLQLLCSARSRNITPIKSAH